MSAKSEVADLFERVNRVHELFAILVNQKRYDADTYGEAMAEILRMLHGPDAVVLLMALVESHTQLKERLFDEGVLELRTCDDCIDPDASKH